MLRFLAHKKKFYTGHLSFSAWPLSAFSDMNYDILTEVLCRFLPKDDVPQALVASGRETVYRWKTDAVSKGRLFDAEYARCLAEGGDARLAMFANDCDKNGYGKWAIRLCDAATLNGYRETVQVLLDAGLPEPVLERGFVNAILARDVDMVGDFCSIYETAPDLWHRMYDSAVDGLSRDDAAATVAWLHTVVRDDLMFDVYH